MKWLVVMCYCLISCQDTKDNYTPIVNFLNKGEVCVDLRKGGVNCFDFKEKKVYLQPFFDTIHGYLNINTRDSNFKALHNNWSFYKDIDSLYGLSLDSSFFKDTDINYVDNIKDADITISITPYFRVEDNTYCIIRIVEGILGEIGGYELYIVNLKISNNDIVAKQVIVFTD